MKNRFSLRSALFLAALMGAMTIASAATVDPHAVLAHGLAALNDPSLALLGFGAAGYTSKALRDLSARKVKEIEAMRAITNKASAENRDVTQEEDDKFKAHKAELVKIEAAIEREETLAAAESSVQLPAGARIETEDNRAQDPRLGFRSFGEYAAAVQAATRKANPVIDQRFAAAPSLFSGEGSGADGGYAVPPEFSREIFALSLEEDNLMPLTDGVELGQSNTMAFPKDESTPWGSDGVRAAWQAEGTAGTPTKINLTGARLQLHKLLALVPVSDELLADATAIGTYLPGLMARSIRWKTNEAFFFGTGSGQPAGAFNSGAVETVVKETGQAAGTLLIENIANMIARLPPGSYGRAIWMLNNDVLPVLFTLKLGDHAIYIPASEGAKANPYGSLMGRPIMVTQHAKSLSSAGDVMLADWKYYRTITKASGMETATSMHLYFDSDSMAFRTTFRVDGQSKLKSSITPANGSNKLAPFIKLGAR